MPLCILFALGVDSSFNGWSPCVIVSYLFFILSHGTIANNLQTQKLGEYEEKSVYLQQKT